MHSHPYLPIVGNQAELSSLVVQHTDAIKLRKVENFLFNFRIKKSQQDAFNSLIPIMNVLDAYLILYNLLYSFC